MKLRRQRGATLGLVAACVFLVILVGVGFFFLSKIIGGGREVANATDAGVLNVAKQAVRRGAVPLTGGLVSEFGALTEPPDSKVDLVTYNRLVAQALIVGKNAEALGGTAVGHANQLKTDVRTIGRALRNNLISEPNFATDFSSIASQNNTKMWNGPAVSLVGAVSSGYMKPGSSTNVYFSPATLAALGGWAPPLSSQTAKGDPAAKYLAGYTPFNVNGSANFLTGVPVLPQTKPHLVDHGQFNTSSVDADTPPNAFRTNSQALEGKSAAMGTSVACAIVGVINKEFQAVIPRGFIRVSNGKDAELGNGNPPLLTPVSNGANDIFNNELFPPSGSPQGVFAANPSGTNPVFTTNVTGSSMPHPGLDKVKADWAAYKATLGSCHKGDTYTDLGGNPAINNITDEPGAGNYGAGDPNIWISKNLGSYLVAGSHTGASGTNIRSTDGSGAHGQYASYEDLLAYATSSGGPKPCDYTMYTDAMPATDPCASNLPNWQANYGRNATFSGGTQQGGFTNVEYMKADLLGKINNRKGGSFCAAVGGGLAPSGLKAWPTSGSTVLKSGTSGSAKPYLGPGTNINFMKPGTTLTYIKQLDGGPGVTGSGGCTTNLILDQMTKRMQQVEPTVTRADVEAALNDSNYPLTLVGTTAPAPMSPGASKLYLYVDSSTKKPKMTNALPWSDTGIDADGPAPAAGTANQCDSTYPLNGWAVNTSKNHNGSIGDGGYHEVPFTSATPNNQDLTASPPEPGTINGTDTAQWRQGSGYNNLLGELKFQQTVEGATFCKPN
ncbi:MAG: hypothetical protein QG574_4771 [Cyanobacteriota bacterium erpe_2018_sw_21hr_WHONDRS-SW48-000092_B_bin.40]|nr:hypothetical protein [Cyanobacteriota bacterium erpe_2018_sw_21hr_WHONDRS-SW48-000092_B_bin.40]